MTPGPARADRIGRIRDDAFQLYDAGRYHDAAPGLDAVLKRRPSDAEAHVRRGDVYLWTGEPERALAHLDAAIRIDPSREPAYRLRAAALARLGRDDQARASVDAAIRLDPTDAVALKDRGGLGIRQRQFAQAIADLDTAIQLDPRLASAYANRGVAYGNLGQLERARADLDRAIELDPRLVSAHANSGRVRFALGDYERAVLDLSEAIRLDDRNAAARLNRGSAYARLGMIEPATDDFEAALQLDQSAFRTYAGPDIGPRELVAREYAQVSAAEPADADGYCARGSRKRARGDWDGAIADFTEALRIDPKSAQVHVLRGWSRLAVGRDAAAADARAYLDLRRPDDGYAPYMALLGHLAARHAGDADQAQRFLTEGLLAASTTWPRPLFAYLRREISADELRAAATDLAQQTEAAFVIGLDQLFLGDRDVAALSLRWAADHGADRTIFRDVARETVRRLEQR
jgi:tetratricopeptide (TPR) repeat protein